MKDSRSPDGMTRLVQERSHANHWFNRASDLRASAGAVWHAMDAARGTAVARELGLPDWFSMSAACGPVYHLLCGMALEVIMKALLVMRGEHVPPTHNLEKLAQLTRVEISETERSLLKYYTQAVVWMGRYPVPLNPDDRNLLEAYAKLSEALTSPAGRIGNLRIRRSNGAAHWDKFHALWLRWASQFEFQP